MKIAYLCCDFGVPVFGFKGASIHLREMVEAFRRQGHSVQVIWPATRRSDESDENRFRDDPSTPPVSLRPVPPDERQLELFKEFEKLDRFLGTRTRIRQEVRNLLYNLTLLERARETLLEFPVDFIYERYTLASYAGIRLARDLGVPHVLEVNAPLAYEQEKMRGLEMKDLARELERRILCETDGLLVVSRRLADYALSCGADESRIHVIPNAVDPERFRAAREGRSVAFADRPRDKRIIGFLGALKPWHGIETLLDAFRLLRARRDDAHVLIVGDGPERERLEAFVEAHGLSDDVTFTGAVAHGDVPGYLAAMDIAVAPYTPNENFYFSPIKIFEYMIMGKPVAAGRIGQVAEVITDGETGRLYEPGDVGQLSAVLEELVDDPAQRSRLGERARSWVESERTWDNNAAEVVRVVRELQESRCAERTR